MPSDTQNAPVFEERPLGRTHHEHIGYLCFSLLTWVFKFLKPAPPPVVETMAHVGWSPQPRAGF